MKLPKTHTSRHVCEGISTETEKRSILNVHGTIPEDWGLKMNNKLESMGLRRWFSW